MRAPAGCNAMLAHCKPEPTCSPHQGNTQDQCQCTAGKPRPVVLHCRLLPAPPSLTEMLIALPADRQFRAPAPACQCISPALLACSQSMLAEARQPCVQAHWVASASGGLALRALEWRVARRIGDDALHGADGRGDGDDEADEADGLRMRTHTPQSPQAGVLQSNKQSQYAWQRRRACIHHQVPDQRWTLFCTM